MALFNNILFNTGFLCGLNSWFTPSFMFCNPVRSFSVFNLFNMVSCWNNLNNNYEYRSLQTPVFNFDNITESNYKRENFKNGNSVWNNYAFDFSGISSNRNYDRFDFSGIINNTNNTSRQFNSSYQKQLAEKALSYEGNVNSDAEGNRLFSNGKKRAWCADFVTYNAKSVLGSKLPSDFGCVPELNLTSSAVSGIQEWAKINNCYLKTDNMSAQEKKNYIAKNIKPGYIMIEKGNGASHTGIVTEVHSDGSFVTIEGNSDSKVQRQRHEATSASLSGFVTLDKYSV